MLFLYCPCVASVLQNGRVAATPRQLEAMIRISEALARMHLRTEVGTKLGPHSRTTACNAGLVVSVIHSCQEASMRHQPSCSNKPSMGMGHSKDTLCTC